METDAGLVCQAWRGLIPTPEVYVKGPGLIFKGNPKN